MFPLRAKGIIYSSGMNTAQYFTFYTLRHHHLLSRLKSKQLKQNDKNTSLSAKLRLIFKAISVAEEFLYKTPKNYNCDMFFLT